MKIIFLSVEDKRLFDFIIKTLKSKITLKYNQTTIQFRNLQKKHHFFSHQIENKIQYNYYS